MRLYLGRRCPNDCRDARRLPRLTELTRCCVAKHCFSGFVTSSARGVAGQIDRNAVPSTAPEEKGGGRRLRDFSPMVEISPVLPALVSCALLQAFCWGSDKQPKRLTRAEAVGWVLWPRGVALPGCSGRWGCGLRFAGSVLLAALGLVRQLAVGLWRAADTLCCPRGLARRDADASSTSVCRVAVAAADLHGGSAGALAPERGRRQNTGTGLGQRAGSSRRALGRVPAASTGRGSLGSWVVLVGYLGLWADKGFLTLGQLCGAQRQRTTSVLSRAWCLLLGCKKVKEKNVVAWAPSSGGGYQER